MQSKLAWEPDVVDSAIIRALSRDARQPYAEIGRKVGLTGPAIAERVARLKDAGVIRGFTLDVDPVAMGRPVSAIVEFTPHGGDYEPLLTRLSSAPEVQTCYTVTGDVLAVLVVRVATNDDLTALLRSLHAVGRTRTTIVLDTHAGGADWAGVDRTR